MERKKFCIHCAAPLIRKFTEGRSRLFCRSCQRPIYENPVPASCTVVVNTRRQVLLVKRNIPPKVGQWCLPGGFIELGESPEDGALRELAEETGLQGKIKSLLGVVTTPSAEYHSVLMVGYLVTDYSGRPEPGDDADAVEWFAYTRLPVIAFDSHRRFMRQYFEPDVRPLNRLASNEPPPGP